MKCATPFNPRTHTLPLLSLKHPLNVVRNLWPALSSNPGPATLTCRYKIFSPGTWPWSRVGRASTSFFVFWRAGTEYQSGIDWELLLISTRAATAWWRLPVVRRSHGVENGETFAELFMWWYYCGHFVMFTMKAIVSLLICLSMLLQNTGGISSSGLKAFYSRLKVRALRDMMDPLGHW